MGKDRSKPNQALQEGDRPYAHLEWRGEVVLLGSRCLNTASGVRADYADLLWDIRKAGQYIQQTQKKGTTPDILRELKRVFSGTILVGDEKNPGYDGNRKIAS